MNLDVASTGIIVWAARRDCYMEFTFFLARAVGSRCSSGGINLLAVSGRKMYHTRVYGSFFLFETLLYFRINLLVSIKMIIFCAHTRI